MRDPAANTRLTALTGLGLLLLLAAEGATLVSLQSFLTWHILLGVLLVPVVGLKLATTGYRFMRYYGGDPAYVAAGPPPLPLRLLGPVVVCSTVGLFGTGILLVLLGPGTGLVLPLHKAAFVVWFGAMSTHVLGHALKVRSVAASEISGRAAGARLRGGLVAAAIVAGALLAVAAVPLVAPWTDWLQRG
jgi:hypothetical protein